MRKIVPFLGMSLWVIGAGLAAILLWGVIVPSIPFTRSFWAYAQTQPIYSGRDASIVGASFRAQHRYLPRMVCTARTMSLGRRGLTYSEVNLNVPEAWPRFVGVQAYIGCKLFMRDQFNTFVRTVVLKQPHD